MQVSLGATTCLGSMGSGTATAHSHSPGATPIRGVRGGVVVVGVAVIKLGQDQALYHHHFFKIVEKIVSI